MASTQVPSNMRATFDFQWITPPEIFKRNWKRITLSRRLKMATNANRLAKHMEADMKQNAPWKDKTGKAREALTAKAYYSDTTRWELVIEVFYDNVPYGYWLEVIQRGKYSIIGPTLAKYRGLTKTMIQEILDQP